MIFANEDMSSKLLQKHVFPVDTERLLIEINFRKSKWLLSPTIHHPNIIITIRIRLLIQIFIMILLFGDFNSEISEVCLDSFLNQHDLKNLVEEKTYFKSMSTIVA